MNKITDLLETTKDAFYEVKQLALEFIESSKNYPSFEENERRRRESPELYRSMMTSTGIMTASIAFIPNLQRDGMMHDFVFRGQETIPEDIFHERVEKFREKHKDFFEPIEVMHKKVYNKELIYE